ncbi:hypothetical protein OQA88_13460 [Cercophora sp. LCS_1]
MAATAEHTYTPLPKDHIRLLILHSSKASTDPIHCQFVDYHLSDSELGTHPYEALSYVWGSPADPQTLFVGSNGSLSVTRNLTAALIRLRHRALTRVLWVDLMAKIYTFASRVVVWLEEAVGAVGSDVVTTESDRGLDELYAAAKRSTMTRPRAEEPTVSRWEAEWGGNSKRLPEPEVFSEEGRQAVWDLLQRPWFQRVWTCRRGIQDNNTIPDNLLPDYSVSWREVFGRLSQSVFGEKSAVKTWDGEELSIVHAAARILGSVIRVLSGEEGSQGGKSGFETVMATLDAGTLTFENLEAKAMSVQHNDVLCLFDGQMAAPVILRPRRDYWTVVSVGVTLDAAQKLSLMKQNNTPSAEYLVIWDWEQRVSRRDDDSLFSRYPYFTDFISHRLTGATRDEALERWPSKPDRLVDMAQGLALSQHQQDADDALHTMTECLPMPLPSTTLSRILAMTRVLSAWQELCAGSYSIASAMNSILQQNTSDMPAEDALCKAVSDGIAATELFFKLYGATVNITGRMFGAALS